MIHTYRAFGLTLAANQPIPLLDGLEDNCSAEVFFEVTGECRALHPPSLKEGWELLEDMAAPGVLRQQWQKPADGGVELLLHLHGPNAGALGTVEFHIDPHARHTQVRWHLPLTEADLWPLWLSLVMPHLLGRRGALCLHAGVVALDGHAYLLLGNKGAGKSTTVGALLSRGHTLLADDLAALTERDGRFLAWPGYGRVNLWPEALRALGHCEAGLPRALSIIDKRSLPVKVRAGTEPLPLAGCFLLGPRRGASHAPAATRLTPAQALAGLAEHRSHAHLPASRSRQRNEFEQLGRLVQTVPVWRIDRANNLLQLPQLAKLIENLSANP